MIFRKLWIICRVCLKQQDELFSLFDDTVHNNIWALLRDCGGVPVRKNDSLPDKICESCLARLWIVMNFRIDCQRSHRDLLQKQTEDTALLYEEENCVQLFTISKIPGPAQIATKEEQQMSAYPNDSKENVSAEGYNDDSTVDHSDKHNVKQYCIVTKNAKSETTPSCDGESKPKQPIILLLRLKNIPNDSSQKAAGDLGSLVQDTNVTDVKIKKSKKTVTETLNKVVEETKDNVQLTKMETKTKLQTSGVKKSKLAKGNNEFVCDICKKIFKSQELLRHHTYIHNKPYECKVCHKKFSQRQSFLSHTNYHTGIKPYYCRICFETFSDISNRNCHERQRHNEQQFKCSSCDKTFRFLALLQAHSYSHKPKKCLICDKDFASVRMVRMHHRRKHLKLLAL